MIYKELWMRSLLVIICFFSSCFLIAQENIKKEIAAQWHSQFLIDHPANKVEYKNNLLTINNPKKAQLYGIIVLTEVKTEKDKVYELKFKMKGNGGGSIQLSHQSFPAVFDKNIEKTNDLSKLLGLFLKLEPTRSWQRVTATFKAQENLSKSLMESIVFSTGTYEGELNFSDFSLVEKTKKNNLIPPFGELSIKANTIEI